MTRWRTLTASISRERKNDTSENLEDVTNFLAQKRKAVLSLQKDGEESEPFGASFPGCALGSIPAAVHGGRMCDRLRRRFYTGAPAGTRGKKPVETIEFSTFSTGLSTEVFHSPLCLLKTPADYIIFSGMRRLF